MNTEQTIKFLLEKLQVVIELQIEIVNYLKEMEKRGEEKP